MGNFEEKQDTTKSRNNTIDVPTPRDREIITSKDCTYSVSNQTNHPNTKFNMGHFEIPDIDLDKKELKVST